MEDLLKRAGGKLLATVLGVAATLTWWTFTGSGGGDAEQFDELPAVVFDGGGGTFTITFETNAEAVFKANFSQWDELDDESREIYAQETFSPGRWIETVEVPRDGYVYFEVGVPDPEPGASLSWTVSFDGTLVYEESESLDKPLEPGYAFFVNFEVDDMDYLREWIAER